MYSRGLSGHVGERADAHVVALIAAGAVPPVIDRVIALDEASDAMRDLAGGRVRGKVVISTSRDGC